MKTAYRNPATAFADHRNSLVKRACAPLLAALLAVGVLSNSASAAQPKLVPQPREMQLTGTTFNVDRNTKLVVPGDALEDRWAAESLQAELREAGGLQLAIDVRGPDSDAQVIVLGRLNDPSIQREITRLGLNARELAPEGYLLNVSDRSILVAGVDAPGLFYGVQTLRQLFVGQRERGTIAGVNIRDWPSLKYRGMQVDLARGPVPTLAYMKRIIATIAEFKLNQAIMYMEDSFQSPDTPLIGVLSDVFTMDEWREVVAFARKHHVDIVPAPEFAGHLRKVLRFEQYSDMAERPHGNVLAPDHPQTIEFVKKMGDDLMSIFPSKFILVGFDETFELGRGQTAERVRTEGFATVFADFLKKVHGHFTSKGKTVMFWGDMVMRHPDEAANLPKDLIAMPWAYFPEESYAKWIDPFVKIGMRIQPACWVGGSGNLMVHDYQQAAKNIAGLTDQSRKAGAVGISNTIWGDNGEAIFAPNWWSLVYGAACAWEPAPTDVDQFNQKYDWVFYRNTDDRLTKAIWQISNINEIIRPTGVGRSWGLANFGGTQADTFWRNPFSPEGREEIQKALPVARKVRLEAEAAYTVLARDAALARRNADTLAFFRFVALRLDALAMRWQYMDEMSQRYSNAYAHRSDPDHMLYKFDMYELTGTNGRMQDLRDYTTRLKLLYSDVFLAENRPQWLPNVLQLFDRQSLIWQDKIAQLADVTNDFKARRPMPTPAELGFFTVDPEKPKAPLLTNDEIPAAQPKPKR